MHRHWDTLIEWKALLYRPEEWRENHGHTHTLAHRAQLTQETAETLRSCLFPCLWTQQTYKGRHTHTYILCVINFICFCVLLDKDVAKTALSVWQSSSWFCLHRTTGQLDFVLLLLFENIYVSLHQLLKNMHEYCTCTHLTCSNWVFWRLNWTQTNLFWPPRASRD